MLFAWIEPIITAHEPMVRGPPPPPPPAPGLGWLPFLLLALSLAWWLARKWSQPGTKRAARVAAFGVAIGNALIDIAAMLQPERPTAAEIQRVREEPRQKERERGNGDGGSAPPRPSPRPRE
jgi:hypothetical protein